MQAKVLEIYYAPEAGARMEYVSSIEAIAGRGLAGDRYEREAGTYTKFSGARDVTLLEIEALWAFECNSGIVLHPGLTRRNLITEGVKLVDLIDVEFSIGPVLLRGLRLYPPCLYLAQLLKIPEILRGLAHSGGIYASILNSGKLRAGDHLMVQSTESS